MAGYTLKSLQVSPHDLLLDPNNPRLRTDNYESKPADPTMIANPNVQRALLKDICAERHAIEALMLSIRQQGFIELDAILVKRLPRLEKYLVIEGNRRTAAIKRLLERGDLNGGVIRSLEKLPVKEIIVDKDVDERSIIDRIVAVRHVSGPKDWEPMQRAYAVYETYKREFRKRYESARLKYSRELMQEVASMLGQDEKKARQEVLIFQVFKMLLENGCVVRSEHYSLIDMMISRPKFASDYFGVDRQMLYISPAGMERFNALCIEKGCPIQNPNLFRLLYRVYRSGDATQLELIRSGAKSVTNVVTNIQDRKRSDAFLESTKRIFDELKTLKLAGFRETPEEAEVIFHIKTLVDERLWPLAVKVFGLDREKE
jgi:ParB/Sulfiredoxin domain